MHAQQKVMKASGGLRNEKKNEHKKNTEEQKNKKKANKQMLAPSYQLPFDQEWPVLTKLHNAMILDELKSVLRERVCDQKLLERKRKLMRTYPDKSLENIEEILQQIAVKREEYADRNIRKVIQDLNDSSKITSLKPFLLLGINSITRYLEKHKDIVLLVVCKSAKPSLMTQHLLCQCLISGIPACSIHGLSETVSSTLGLKSVLALAFKDLEANPFDDVINFIQDKIPNTSAPWVDLWRTKMDSICIKNNSTKNTISNEIENTKGLVTEKNSTKLYCSDYFEEAKPMETKLFVTPDKNAETSNQATNRKRKYVTTVELEPLNIEWKEKKQRKKKKT